MDNCSSCLRSSLSQPTVDFQQRRTGEANQCNQCVQGSLSEHCVVLCTIQTIVIKDSFCFATRNLSLAESIRSTVRQSTGLLQYHEQFISCPQTYLSVSHAKQADRKQTARAVRTCIVTLVHDAGERLRLCRRCGCVKYGRALKALPHKLLRH